MSSASVSLSVQQYPFDAGVELAALQAFSPSVGGVASFVGVMRDSNEGDRVNSMLLEHYPGMTEKAIGEVIGEAENRWPLLAVRVVHRVGELYPGDPIVLVGVAAAHRGAAFSACELIMDFLKTRAPFWKKERTARGERWVAARHSDREALERWQR